LVGMGLVGMGLVGMGLGRGGYKCCCDVCDVRVSHKGYCKNCPNRPAGYVNEKKKAYIDRYESSESRMASKEQYQAKYQPAYRAVISEDLRKDQEAWHQDHCKDTVLNDESAQVEVSDRALISPPRTQRISLRAHATQAVHVRKLCMRVHVGTQAESAHMHAS